MKTHSAYCSACDRNVPVLVRHGEWEVRAPSVQDAAEAILCLDYGVRCTGAMCPLFEFGPDDPARRAAGDPERGSP